ncbi:MAG TPA: metallophosphoesterase [Gemmataceae bacterium]|nr:metallophosphoesterase [Gemmataceae bacterium]
MPDPEKLLQTIRKAAEYSRATPGRRGRVIYLPDATEVLATGDLHGNIANFQRILKVAELAKHPRRHLVMQELIHGRFSYAEGGEKSHQAVDLWCALKCQYPTRVHYLPGNHELSQWTNRLIGKDNEDLNANFRDGVRTAYGPHADAIYAAYLELFAALPLAVRTSNRIFLCHSLPSTAAMAQFDYARLENADHQPADFQSGGLVYALVWGRDTSAENAANFLRKVDADWLVTGHIPCETGFAVPNERQIILDCMGAAAGYCLLPTDRLLAEGELRERVKLL